MDIGDFSGGVDINILDQRDVNVSNIVVLEG